MAKAKKPSTIPQDVAAQHAGAMPLASAKKFNYDFETDRIVPANAAADLPGVMKNIQIETDGKGKMTAYIPELATGSMSWNPQYNDPTNWNFASFAAWGTVDNNVDGKMDMRRALFYWKTDPLVYKCVELLTQLSNAAITIACPNPAFQEILDNWLEVAMPSSFRQQWFLEYFRTGYCVSLKTLIPYVPRNYRDGKVPKTSTDGNIEMAKAEMEAGENKAQELMMAAASNRKEYETAVDQMVKMRKSHEQGLCSIDRLDKMVDDVTQKQYKWQLGMIPGAYTLLDPQAVELSGPVEIPWLREPFLRVTGQLAIAINGPVGSQSETLKRIPFEISSQVKQGLMRVWLSPNICDVSFADKQSYERYPTPIISHAFKALDMKEQIHLMDMATVHSVKNRILKVTVGNDTYPVFDPNAIAQVQRLFYSNPNKNTVLFWNHTLELEWIEPKLDSFKDSKKYDHWNDEIRTVFGVSRILTGTSETSGAASVMNFKGIEQMVISAQNAFLEFLNKEIRMLKAALNLAQPVEASFDQLNLKDEVQFWGVISQAVLNGIIDHETALETLRFHFPTILERMKKIKKIQDDDEVFLPQPSANNMGPQEDGSTGIPSGGRPKGKTNNKKTGKGKSKPKTKAKAKIEPVNGCEVRVVVESEIDSEQREQIADTLGVDIGWVMTAAAFEKSFGKKVDFRPSWPELLPMEMVKAARKAEAILKEVRQSVENKIASLKDTQATGSKRGPYATEKTKQGFFTSAMESAKASIIASIPKERMDQSMWDRHMVEVERSLATDLADVSVEERTITAWTVCQARCLKTV